MDLDGFNTYCGSLPATEKVVQWGGAHVWKVGGKILAISGPWGEDRPDKSFNISFKCSDLAWEILKEQPGIIPAPYLARAKWVLVLEKDALSDAELRGYIEAAHAVIASKLTKAKKRELGLSPD